MPAESMMFQLVVCWFFSFTGRCEPMVVSRPVPLEICERAQVKIRASGGKLRAAYCL